MRKNNHDHGMPDYGTDSDIFDAFERMAGWIAVIVYVIALGLVVWAIGGWW